ncbi:MAG: M48 family metallopeptidase [bacterium]|nr:M48 family metallopeptidase [bacterium]
MYTQVSKNIRKTWLLITVFLIFIIGLGWLFGQVRGEPMILYFAVGFSFLMSFFSYWYSDKIVLAMTRAKPIEKKDAPELYRVVENLCITAGLPLPKIYIISDPAPNAFATGRDPKRAVVAVTSGLLEILERSEIEGVIAHELSHIGNRDMLVSTVVVILVGIVAMTADFFLRMSFWGGFSRGSRDRGQAGAILMIVGLIAAILAPIAAILIQLAISRKREFLADASGALLTRYPDGLASALKKIGAYPQSVRHANDATAHLYFASPFRGKQAASWFSKLFLTHPPIEERINALQGLR